MAELVGGALLSAFLDVVFDRLASPEVFQLFNTKKAISVMLDELKVTMLSANALLIDAEVKQFTDQNVKKWLEELKEVFYEVDHVIDKINTEALRRMIEGEDQSGSISSKVLSSISTLFSPFDNVVKHEIEDILRRIKLLLSQKDCLGLRSEGVAQTTTVQRIPAPLVEESDVYGRDAEKEAIVNLLFSKDVKGPKISVLPIVGMGGIGKTTLAQLVYKDKRVEKQFDPRVWVTVSEEFDVLRITKEVLDAIISKKHELGNLYQLQEELKKALSGKKFLFILDDVWNENYKLWDTLKSPFESGAHGSKIIVTTRSRDAASMMGTVEYRDLQGIDKDNCWKLFMKHVFNNVDDGVHLELQEIGMELVKKCKGLPLAVKSIAGLLRSTSDPKEWKKIHQSDVWELQFMEDQKNKIPPALWLSYHFLPPPLKRCFVYCSIFPKNYEFQEVDKERLVLLWMAEGLLQPKKGKRMEDVGEEYLNALISRSFFQFQSISSSKKSSLVMHDLVHDLAIRMSGEFSVLSNDGGSHNKLMRKTNHLSYRKNSRVMVELEGLSKDKGLRTLLALPLHGVYSRNSFVTKLFQDQLIRRDEGCLRVMSLSGCYTLELSDSIGNLKHLRYLDLSGSKIKELPSSVCTLYNLQTLLLSHCEELMQLPKDMYKLINIRHLRIEDTPLKEMPPLVCNMKNLQTLTDFVLNEKDGRRIKEMGDLQLHGRLCISGLESVSNVEDCLKTNLKNKDGLDELILKWNTNSETNDTRKEKQVLEALQPHTKLMMLHIDGFRGTNFPNWVTNQSLCGITKVRVERCKNCYLLPPFGLLPSLKELEIEDMDGVSSVGDEFLGFSSSCLNFQPFPCLEKLSIKEMGCWEKWSFSGAEQGVIFPRLNNLWIENCDKLNFGLSGGCFPSLERVSIFGCKSVVSVFPFGKHIDINYPSLLSITLYRNERLESFFEMGKALPSTLQVLTIWKCGRLFSNRLNWDLQRNISLQTLSLHFMELEDCNNSFPEEGMLPTTLNELQIASFNNLKSLNGKALQRLTSLQKLSLIGCKQLRWFPEEGLPDSLTYLDIIRCPLLKERCQRGTGEDWPKIQHINIIEIDWKEI